MQNRNRLRLLTGMKTVKGFFFFLFPLEAAAQISKKRTGTAGKGLMGSCFHFGAVLDRKKRAGMRGR